MQPRPPRPTGVTILAILAILGGIVLLVGGAGLLAFAGLLTIANLSNTPLSGIDIATVQLIFSALGAVLLVLGILYLIVGIGYWGGKGWAWTLGIVVTVISLIVDIVQIGINPVSAAGNVFGILIALIILYYLTRRHVKAFFGKAPWGPPTMGGGAMTAMTGGMPPSSTTQASPTMVRCNSCGAMSPMGTTKCPSCGAAL